MNKKLCNLLLIIPSLIYKTVTGIRNFLFDIKILKSESFALPVISVGNITVGGTGKTPFTEYLISELSRHFKIACLSRGYRRHSKGFIIARTDSGPEEIGDEPYQIKRKFPETIVACDADRRRGIRKLMALPHPPEVIILDDGFQHRYVKADKHIVLVDYNRPIYKDHLLPMGRLRESAKNIRRADYIIITKCPDIVKPIDIRLIIKNLNIRPYQKIFFSCMRYKNVRSLSEIANFPSLNPENILCITGIAYPKPYYKYLKSTYNCNIHPVKYPDHHWYSSKDWEYIGKIFENLPKENRFIFTTEKDAVRMQNSDIPRPLKENIFYIPIEPVFIHNKRNLIKELYDHITQDRKDL